MSTSASGKCCVWSVHRKVCGQGVFPLRVPGLTDAELKEALSYEGGVPQTAPPKPGAEPRDIEGMFHLRFPGYQGYFDRVGPPVLQRTMPVSAAFPEEGQEDNVQTGLVSDFDNLRHDTRESRLAKNPQVAEVSHLALVWLALVFMKGSGQPPSGFSEAHLTKAFHGVAFAASDALFKPDKKTYTNSTSGESFLQLLTRLVKPAYRIEHKFDLNPTTGKLLAIR
ncbi:hypothetical protein JCM10207_004836 [Rhodosporidiobolus poonsookiae]